MLKPDWVITCINFVQAKLKNKLNIYTMSAIIDLFVMGITCNYIEKCLILQSYPVCCMYLKLEK